MRDWKGAEANFRRAMELNPSLAMNHYHYAWYLALFGRLEEAIKEHRRAQELDPLTPLHTAWLAGLYILDGQYDKAIEEADKCLRLNAKSYLGLLNKGEALARKGMYEEAIAVHRKAAEINPSWKFCLGVTYVMAGRNDEARKILAEMERVKPTPFGAYALANLFASLGENDKAFQWLAYEPAHGFVPWFRVDRRFYPVRDDPRFQQMLRKYNLPDVK